jgi:hypothetical protein
MKRSKFSDEQVAYALRQPQARWFRVTLQIEVRRACGLAQLSRTMGIGTRVGPAADAGSL